MYNWLKKYLKIKQNHLDLSDYENFYKHSKNYILTADLKTQKKISKILTESLASFKNKTLLSISYRLLEHLNCELKIERKILKKHFKSPLLRKYIYPIIQLKNITYFDRKLIKLLYDPLYECKNFFNLLKSKEEWVKSFLHKEDLIFIRKQMLVIIHTGLYYNIEYYIGFIGDRNRNLSFYSFELCTLFIKKLITENRSNKILFEGSKYIIEKINGTVCIRPTEKIEVGSITNFIIHFADFMGEKDKLLEELKNKNFEGVKKILNKYIKIGDEPFSLPDERWFNKTTIQQINNKFLEEDIDFNYLFEGRTYKDITDCIEI